jgi:ATP-binding cassette, subfamily B, bacterial
MKDNTKKTIKYYWQHTKKYKVSGFFILIGLIGAAVSNVVVPLYFKKFFDVLTSGGATDIIAKTLVSILILILIVEFLQWFFWRLATFLAAYFQTKVMADLAVTCFEYLHKHSFAYFNNNFVGSLVKRVNRFVRSFEGISDRLAWNLIPLFVNLSMIIVVLSWKSTIIGLLIIGWLVIFMVVNWLFTKYKLKYDIERAEAETRVTGVLADTITNHPNVKLFNGYKSEVGLFANVNDKLRRLQKLTWDLDNYFEALQGFLMIGLEIGIFYLAIGLWQKGIFTVGDFVLLQSYVITIFLKIWDFGRVIRHFYRDLADAEEMTEILEAPHEIVDNRGATELVITKGEIEFKDVSFNYRKTRKIFSNFNLKIKSNERVAFIGPSGSGKSTITRLLLRLHDISGGKILIDGQKIKAVTQESLWQNISLVPQDPILFHRTLMENIRYGKPGSSDEEVVEAAKLAHCHEFVSELPEGYGTYVGERGIKLSGGERQRIAIARAILRDAPILVLDEATSSLDSESESFIQDALDTLMKKKTVIVIAHRLSTIMKTDRIVVVDRGEIVEEGSHQKLLKKRKGVYKKLWDLQAGGFIE